MEVGFKSDKGLKRSNNEDACFVLLTTRSTWWQTASEGATPVK